MTIDPLFNFNSANITNIQEPTNNGVYTVTSIGNYTYVDPILDRYNKLFTSPEKAEELLWELVDLLKAKYPEDHYMVKLLTGLFAEKLEDKMLEKTE